MSENHSLRRSIAAELLGHELDADGYAPCPGREFHSHNSGKRDFRVVLDGAPTAYCFHSSCGDAVEIFNLELRRRIGRAEFQGGTSRPPVMGENVPPVPMAAKPSKRPRYDPRKLEEFAKRAPAEINLEWLAERSPVAIPAPGEQGAKTSALFLDALYKPGERVLVFTRFTSQGDFLSTDGKAFRLGDRPNVRAVPSPLPNGGPEGVWFLCNPVAGEWRPNPSNLSADGMARLGRRHGACVTSWRFLVLESDEAPAGLWLRALVQLPLPIVAAYTSGGRSIHALVRVSAKGKGEWDSLRDDLRPILCPLGADPAAMTGVRLTRLPGALRHGSRGKDGKIARYDSPRLQRLLWLNPDAMAAPILDLIKR